MTDSLCEGCGRDCDGGDQLCAGQQDWRGSSRHSWQDAGQRILYFTNINNSVIPSSPSLVNSSVLVYFFLHRNPVVGSSVADPGCLSRIRILSIPDSGSEFFPSRIRIKEFLSILTQNIVSLGNMIRFVHPGSGSWFLPIPDPGVKKVPRNTGRIRFCLSILVDF